MLVKKGDYLKAKKEKSCKSFDLQDFGGERGTTIRTLLIVTHSHRVRKPLKHRYFK